MHNIYIAIVVDVEGALASGSLMDNVYLADNNQYIGSWQQGTSDLHTVCQDGQLIGWWATPVDPATDAVIIGFSGPMVSSRVCMPAQNIIASDHRWSGRVETQGTFGSFPYTVNLSLGGKAMSFDATMKVV